MKQIEQLIFPLVKTHFPDFYQDEGPRFVDFVQQYYKWMGTEGEAINASRNLLDYRNIDTTSESFIKYFKNKYFAGIPISSEANTRFLIKHAGDIYGSKGTERGVQLVIQGVFDQEATVYFPGDDLLKASDGTWVKPVYLELSISDRTTGFVGKEIVGTQSQAKAFLESLVTRRISGKYLQVAYLSNVRGDFVTGELITTTADTNMLDAPSIIGSLSNLTVVEGGANFAVGDIFDIVSSNGKQGKARVTQVSNETGRVTFTYVDALTSGGWGYSLAHSNVIVSSKVLVLRDILNTNTEITTFSQFETLRQPLVNVGYSTARGNNANFIAGNIVENFNSNGTVNAEAIIVSSTATNTTVGYIIVSPVSGNISSVDTTFAVRSSNAANATFNASLVGVSFNTFTATPYTSAFSGGFTGTFSLTYTGSFTGGFTDQFSGVYENSWTRIIGQNIFSAEYTANWTAAYTGVYSSVYNSNVTSSFSQSFVGYYINNPYTGTAYTGASFTSLYSQAGFVGAYGTGAVYTTLPGPGATSFTGAFTGAYTPSFTQAFSGVYTSSFTDSYTSSWIAGFTGAFSPLFTGSFSGNYALSYSRNYTGLYTGSFSRQFTAIFTSQSFSRIFSGTFSSSYALSYTGTYTNATKITTTSPHSFSNGDLVRYEILTGNTAITELSAGAAYYIVNAVSGSSSLSLASTFNGTPLSLTPGSNETGHRLTKTLGTAVITSYADRTATGNTVGSNVSFLVGVFNANSGVANVTNIITTTHPHGLVNNDIIRYVVSAGNTPIGGLSRDGEYYVTNVSSSALQLSLTRDGAAIDITSGSNETGHSLVFETGFLGVSDLSSNGFVITPYANVVGLTTNTHATVANVSTGTGANFSIGLLTDTENVFLSPDFLSSKNTGNVVFHSVRLDGSNSNAAGFGFVKFPSADINTILLDALRFDATTIGSIASITGLNPGSDYNFNPFVAVVDTYVSGYNRRDYTMRIANVVGSFVEGEQIQQTYDLPATQLTVNTFAGTFANGVTSTSFVVGEFVYQSNSTANVAASGFVLESGVSAGAGTVKLGSVTGTFVVTSNITTLLKGLSSGSTSNVQAASLTTSATTARALIKSGSNNSVLRLKRINLENTFLNNTAIIGRSSGTTANVVSIGEDPLTIPVGLNANIVANVQTANNVVQKLAVYDSGFGYLDEETVTLSKQGSIFVVTAKANIQKQGVGAGYYSTTRGFLDSDKKIQDNEYYQEYSYEVQTKIPFDRYIDILKQVTHIAGTKAFGKVSSLSTVNTTMTAINSITLS